MDMIGSHMLPGDYEAALARIAEVAASRPGQRASLVVHYRLVGADGKLRHCHDSMMLEVDQKGRPVAAFGVVVDVSERIREAEAIHEKETQFPSGLSVLPRG